MFSALMKAFLEVWRMECDCTLGNNGKEGKGLYLKYFIK